MVTARGDLLRPEDRRCRCGCRHAKSVRVGRTAEGSLVASWLGDQNGLSTGRRAVSSTGFAPSAPPVGAARILPGMLHLGRRGRAAGHVVVRVALLIALGAGLAIGSTARAAAEPTRSAVTVELPDVAVWPVDPTPEVVRGFDPPGQPWGAGHRGVDLRGRAGQQVRAAAAGRVSYASQLAGRGVVVVDHGAVRTTYEPVTASARVGQRVVAGASIGVLERDSRDPIHCSASTRDHGCLHWGLRHGDTYLDPLLLLTDQPLAGGPVRLLPQASVEEAVTRAAVRSAARAAAAAVSGLGGAVGTGPGGEHGFSLPVGGPVSSGFGMRHHPVLGVWKLHDGTDVAAACGTPLHAPADGTVVGTFADPGYGNRLLIDHGVVDGRHVVTALNHAAGYDVGVGARVSQGQVVGRVGRTGFATGCHLHLMVWLDDVLVDPLTWF